MRGAMRVRRNRKRNNEGDLLKYPLWVGWPMTYQGKGTHEEDIHEEITWRTEPRCFLLQSAAIAIHYRQVSMATIETDAKSYYGRDQK